MHPGCHPLMAGLICCLTNSHNHGDCRFWWFGWGVSSGPVPTIRIPTTSCFFTSLPVRDICLPFQPPPPPNPAPPRWSPFSGQAWCCWSRLRRSCRSMKRTTWAMLGMRLRCRWGGPQQFSIVKSCLLDSKLQSHILRSPQVTLQVGGAAVFHRHMILITKLSTTTQVIAVYCLSLQTRGYRLKSSGPLSGTYQEYAHIQCVFLGTGNRHGQKQERRDVSTVNGIARHLTSVSPLSAFPVPCICQLQEVNFLVQSASIGHLSSKPPVGQPPISFFLPTSAPASPC